MNKRCVFFQILLFAFVLTVMAQTNVEKAAIVPSLQELNRPFGRYDVESFQSPPKIFHPETWFHFLGGNVAKEGITADLEAIAKVGFSGIQLFHGNQGGGAWPGTTKQIPCLSEDWDDAVKFTAEECKRLGLRFTMQNCPGWAMSGGPWIKPENAMRHLAWSRTDVENGKSVSITLPRPQPGSEDWRDYKDITVLAFPTPLDDTGEALQPESFTSNKKELPWDKCLAGNAEGKLALSPATTDNPNWVEVKFPKAVTLRTIEFPSINSLSHGYVYVPDITVKVQALLADGKTQEILNLELPSGSWQDDQPVSLACPETSASAFRISFINKHEMHLNSIRLFSAARKNNWESEAGWTLRSIERTGENPKQSPEAFIDSKKIYDITSSMDKKGNLRWKAPVLPYPDQKWTILRIGHVNAGMKNGPAPAEGTGWECDKLSESGPDAHFAGYIGRLAGKNGAINNGLLNGMLMDSWECKTQTWTANMESEFQNYSGYSLRKWLPAVFGYVVDDHETSKRFLYDWRANIGRLFSDKFYGRMAKHAKDNGLALSFETAAGDIFPADILEYFKYADVPMCEFWQPFSNQYVGSIDFKPIKPTASAARVYGKPRVAAEALTSFSLTWDEHFSMFKEVINYNSIEGVTHLVFHTYTHNPQVNFLQPGTSFGGGIGSPFLRGQTWWKHMPEFVAYISRCSYMLERGKPVSDVLWYLGDEINAKPNQEAPFPAGFKYDYCNPDVLLNRLKVQDGLLVTPEGISYGVLWLPDVPRMLPQTLEKIYQLVQEGATVVGNAPWGLATLINNTAAQQRFDKAVNEIWGNNRAANSPSQVRNVGKGKVISGMSLEEALKKLNINPDVTGDDAMWSHRKIDGADWYFVCSPKGGEFDGTLSFRNTGTVEIWDPVTGTVKPVRVQSQDGRTSVKLDLPQAGSCFVVFRHAPAGINLGNILIDPPKYLRTSTPLANQWTIGFPSGWGAPASLQIKALKAWKDLDISAEAKAFSGTATYTTTFDAGEVTPDMIFSIDLGRVEMIAAVSLNGKLIRTLWAPPYKLDLTEYVRSGENTLSIEVTSSWFNRLVYDAGQPESSRKTWTIGGPKKEDALKEYGLLGPVVLTKGKKIYEGESYMKEKRFAAGDYTSGKVCIVEGDEKISWSQPATTCNDLWILPGGTLLYVAGNSVKEIDPTNNSVKFNYTGKSEIFGTQRLSSGNTLIAECSAGKILELDPNGKIVKTLALIPKKEAKGNELPGGHGFMRNVRQLPNGNYLVAHFEAGEISEYKAKGKKVWNFKAPATVHSTVRLANGNTIVGCGDEGNVGLYEVNPKGEIVWQLTNDDLYGQPLRFIAGFQILPNNNILITNWLGHNQFGVAPHLLEITRDKKVVWAYDDHKQFRTISTVHLFGEGNNPLSGVGFH